MLLRVFRFFARPDQLQANLTAPLPLRNEELQALACHIGDRDLFVPGDVHQLGEQLFIEPHAQLAPLLS